MSVLAMRTKWRSERWRRRWRRACVNLSQSRLVMCVFVSGCPLSEDACARGRGEGEEGSPQNKGVQSSAVCVSATVWTSVTFEHKGSRSGKKSVLLLHYTHLP